MDGMVHERQQHFVLPPFVRFWRASLADESERPLIENRYSPFRPGTAARKTRKRPIRNVTNALLGRRDVQGRLLGSKFLNTLTPAGLLPRGGPC